MIRFYLFWIAFEYMSFFIETIILITWYNLVLNLIEYMKYWLIIHCKIIIYVLVTVLSGQISIA